MRLYGVALFFALRFNTATGFSEEPQNVITPHARLEPGDVYSERFTLDEIQPSKHSSGLTKCCPLGTRFNGQRCVPNTSEKQHGCATGFYFNGQRCVSNTNEKQQDCAAGFRFDGQRCVRDSTEKQQGCATGFHFNGQRCVPDSTGHERDCAAGFRFDGQRCVRDSTEKQPDCAAGFHFNGQRCVRDSTGHEHDCATGFHFNGQQCVSNTIECPSDYELVNGRCIQRLIPRPGCEEEQEHIQECRGMQQKAQDDILFLRNKLASADTTECTALGFGTVDLANHVFDTKDICPQHNGKEFFLPTPDGSTTKWRVYCDHKAYEIRYNAAGYMNATATPYNQLLAHRHWDEGYRAFYWRDTDFFHRHLAIYMMEPGRRQGELNKFTLYFSPGSRHHVIARIDNFPLKIT